ncbi:unnamed protein product [Mytilus edulis]|uniref:SGNH hydrolase-type esterase domain-containing protein n=1 Tax=Mytilus edulis TaxID=6550 RepID=A0A8S3U0X1_MYTED|nr:unnamed protein product [Mytilus edulis]
MPDKTEFVPTDYSNDNTVPIPNRFTGENNKTTLIIGSSILKGIQPRGLQNTEVCTNRGANIDRLIDVLQKKDMSTYRTIIIHIGGNDLDNLQSIRDKYEALLYLLNFKCHPHCKFVVSGILPRKGLNMHNPNEMLKDLCEQFNLQFIDHTNMFYDKNYNLSYSVFHHDGIHLSKKGTSAFLRSVNMHVSILKHTDQSDRYCVHCGEPNHNSKSCRHGRKDTENDDLVTYGFNKCKGLKICSHNVNRLECKFDEIRYNLMSTPNPPDIIGYCETFLGKNTSDREIDIPGYILQRKDRQSDGGGGWAVYLTETPPFLEKMILK